MTRVQIEPLCDNECVCRISQLNSNATDLQINNLKGAVKTINEYQFDAINKFGELSKGKEMKTHNKFVFNDNETIAELTETSKKKILNCVKYNYDNNVCTERIEYRSNGELLSWTSYKYDERGHRIEEVVNHDGGSVERYTCKYNNKGDITEIKCLSPYTYGCNKFYSYEKNKLTIKYFDDKSKLEKQVEYEINDKDEIIKITECVPKVSYFRKKMSKTKEVNLAYNHKGDCITDNSIWYDDENSNAFVERNSTFSYTYDINDNWIKIDCTLGDKYMIIEREIEYYK